MNFYKEVGAVKGEHYPFGYTGVKWGHCFANKKKPDYKFESVSLYTKNDPAAFKEELQKGPMVVGVSVCRDF